MMVKAGKRDNKHFPFVRSELKSLFRNKPLIGSILNIVLTAYPDQESPGNRESMYLARQWLDSLARERMWLLLLLVKSARRLEKLKPGKVKEALQADVASRPMSLAVPIRDPKLNRSSLNLALLDTIREGDDSTDRTQHEHDCSLLRRKIWERAVRADLSSDESRLLKMLLEEDLDICDVKREGFFVKKRGKDGRVKKKKLAPVKVDEMYRKILRKLKCQELRDFVDEF